MKEIKEIKRGEIYYATLDPIKGSEQGGIRPVLIIQNDVGNKYSKTVIVAPITTARKRSYPTHVKVGEDSGLLPDCVVLAEQIRTLDKCRLMVRLGSVNSEVMKEVNRCIKISLGVYDNE